jgi:F-type H+-transporting ATPase subunit b
MPKILKSDEAKLYEFKRAALREMKILCSRTFLWAALLALPFICCAHAHPAQAQEQSATPQKPEVKRAPHERSPGQELAHESRKAAGEDEDQTAEFKQSPSVQLIARLTGLSSHNAFLFSDVLNFVVIAAIIIWAGRKFLPPMFRARTEGIQKAMREAQRASEEARRKLAEIESRLMKLDVEIGMMRDAAEKEAAAEEARIKATTQEDARKIIETSRQEIAAATKAARRELTSYAADLAVGLAKKQIHVDAATDQALVRKFSGDLTGEASSTRSSSTQSSPNQRSGKDGH